ncbi:putative membrane protein YccC [Planotetraspora sp. GP83]
MLLLVQLGGGPGIDALGPRLLDTVIASLIVLLLGYAPWPQARAARITPRLRTRDVPRSTGRRPRKPLWRQWPVG